jgi:hypothetical protein
MLLRLTRFTAWPLVPLVATYIVTGYGMTGEYGLHHVLDPRLAQKIHHLFDGVLLVLVGTHALPGMYLALWRWGWIRRRRINPRPAALSPIRK